MLEIALAGVRALGVFAEIGIAASIDARPTAVRGILGGYLTRRTGDRIGMSGYRKAGEAQTESGNSEKFPHRTHATTLTYQRLAVAGRRTGRSVFS